MTGSSSGNSTFAQHAILRGRSIFIAALLAAGGVLGSLMSAPGLSGVLGAGLALLMLSIAVIDARQFIIPNPLSAAGFGLGLAHAAVQQPQAMLQAVTLAIGRAAVLALLFLTLRSIYRALRGREGLGLGDVKLAAVAGAWLDWLMMPIAIEVAALAALSFYGLRYLAFNRPWVATHRLPFGLYFAPAIWLCWLAETIWLGSF
jgi:leader peptidase (prepilin peptidase) / N-methyltransferase